MTTVDSGIVRVGCMLGAMVTLWWMSVFSGCRSWHDEGMFTKVPDILMALFLLLPILLLYITVRFYQATKSDRRVPVWLRWVGCSIGIHPIVVRSA